MPLILAEQMMLKMLLKPFQEDSAIYPTSDASNTTDATDITKADFLENNLLFFYYTIHMQIIPMLRKLLILQMLQALLSDLARIKSDATDIIDKDKYCRC